MTSNGHTDQNASSCSKDKCLTIGFAIVLFVMTLGCGCIARVTLHIMIWHIGPPMELKNNISRLSTLNGWLKPNSSNCNDTTFQTDMAIKGTWTWAIFLVIITPYVFTILKCLLQICFKSNKQQANKENAHKEKTNIEEKTNEKEMTNEEEKTNEKNMKEKTIEEEKTNEEENANEKEKTNNEEKETEDEKRNKEQKTNDEEKTNKEEMTNEDKKRNKEEKTNDEEKIDEREKTVEKEKTDEKQKTYEAEKAYEEENTNKEKPNENEKTNKEAWTNEVETKKDETTNEEEKTNEKKKINEEGNTNEMNINREEKSNEEEKRNEDEKTEKTAEKKTTEEQAFNIKTCLLMTLTEVIHTVGLCILVFFVLPLFDPILASVVYMATSFLTPFINFGSIIYRVCITNRNLELLRDISGIFGMILQIAGITMLAIYLNDGLMIGLVLIGVIMVSFKHWENFEVDKKDSTCIWQLQNPRPKETCLAYVFKVICTLLTVIFIFTIRNTEIDIFERQTIDLTCQFHIPFILSAIIMICELLCYTSTKIACTINCQKVCFVMPLLLLPLLTTGTLTVAMIYPDMLKIGSCDLLFHDWCFNSGSMYDFWLLFAAFLALCSSIICITVPIWKDSGKTGRTGGVFINPFYCGIFLELSLLKNRRRSPKYVDKYGETINEIKTYDSQTSESKPILCVCCATMWHEEDYEMLQLLKSIMRLGKRQSENKVNTDDTNIADIFSLQAHVFFDDAFIEKEDAEDAEEHPKINHYVETFIKMVKKAAEELLGENYTEDYVKKLTPYGSRLEWTLPCNNKLHVHLKDTNKIRYKKRWSQVMYMSYILKYQYKQPHSKFSPENIFILALDGDVKFEPEALLSLMRRLKKSKKIGAACGRIHPMGTGPMVWYQKFEYAISHWLQKVSEHVTGCVLCTPGCFSLFRGSSILKVLDTYSGVATKPRHYLQYEQGEDRWLCTLLLKKGMKIEYTAESDAYTFVPEGFYKFYNQRRRWTPSTIANIVDLLISWREITKENNNISVLYICYHLCLFVSTLLTPGTIFMLIVGAIIVSFQWIHSLIILILNIIPVSVFMLMCVYASKQKQLQFAAILSCIYGIVMLIGLIGVVRDAVDIGFCSIATIFILFQAGVFIISAILHPKEFLCIIPGFIYFFAIPSMSMLMFLYAIGNLHDVSWGTRDTKSEAKSFIGKSQEEIEQEKGHFCSFGKLCTCMFCSTNNYTKSDYILSILNKWKYREDDLDGNQGNTETGYRVDIEDLEFEESHREQDPEEISFVEVNGYADRESVEIDEQENKWWIQTIKSHLKPFHHVHRDPAKKRKFLQEKKIIEQKLIDMRNQVCLFVYMLNAFLITLIYSLTQVDVFTGSLSIFVNCRGNQIEIVPIAVLFIVVFGFLFLIQFICMIVDRFNTLVNIAARTPTFVNKVTPKDD